MIPYGRQEITQQDIDAVLDVLDSDFLTQGPKVPMFEESVKQAACADYAVAVNSATSALHIACLALGVANGDLVWTTPITFVASANCALYCGAKVDFVDIDAATYNLCPNELEKKLKHARSNNLPLPKVVVPVHLCGQSCDMEKIYHLSIEYGFSIIEDASHAIGGRYKNEPIGNCRYSDITVFSFHPVKIVTTAEGGVALTNNAKLKERMDLFRSHGVTRDVKSMACDSHGPWYYEQIELGFNYRMTELQAALGISQMDRLESFVDRRHKLAQKYYEKLSDLPIVLPYQLPETYSGLHLFVIRLNLSALVLSRLEVFELLRENGIGVNIHYIPVHSQPYYQKMGFSSGDFPIAEKYYSEAISIPMFPTMTDDQQQEVVDVLTRILR